MTQKDLSDILPVQIVDQKLLDEVSARARGAARRRMNHNLHRLPDAVQRMLNAMEPGTYVRPHRHIDPPKIEMFIILRGSAAVLFFDDKGTLLDVVTLSPRGVCAVDIPAGHWHSLIALESGTVLMEAKDGPYVPSTDKDFAPWAPLESDPAKDHWLAELRSKISVPSPA